MNLSVDKVTETLVVAFKTVSISPCGLTNSSDETDSVRTPLQIYLALPGIEVNQPFYFFIYEMTTVCSRPKCQSDDCNKLGSMRF